MIPDNYNLPKPEKKEFELVPAGIYQVVIAAVKLKKDQKVWDSDDVEDKFGFDFVVVKGKYKNRHFWKDCRIIMNPAFEGGSASWLYKVYSAAVNAQLTKDEAGEITSKDINAIEGKQIQLVIKQKPNKKGEIKNSIEDAVPVEEEVEFTKTVDSVKKKVLTEEENNARRDAAGLGPNEDDEKSETDLELEMIGDELEL